MPKTSIRRQQEPAPAKIAPSEAHAMSPSDSAKHFGAEAPGMIDPLGGLRPQDFKCALLTQDRFVIYTTLEKRKGENGHDFTIYRRGPVTVAIFTNDVILEEGIEGIIPEPPEGA